MSERPTTDPFGKVIWILILAAAVALAAYGVYLIAAKGKYQIGPFLIGLALIFVPVPMIAVIGALIIIGTGVYCLTVGAMLYGIVFILLGLVTLADRGRELTRPGAD